MKKFYFFILGIAVLTLILTANKIVGSETFVHNESENNLEVTETFDEPVLREVWLNNKNPEWYYVWYSSHLFGDPAQTLRVKAYEHDIAVTHMDADSHVSPNENVTVNATIFNLGSNKETNILVSFRVNGIEEDNKVISSLNSSDSTNLTFNWTTPPIPTEGYVTISINASVTYDNVTSNNEKEETVVVGPDIAVSSLVAPDVTIGTNSNFTAYVSNLGISNHSDITIDFKVNGSTIYNTTISLESGEGKNVTFQWDASGYSAGNYNVEIYAELVEDENYTLNQKQSDEITVYDSGATSTSSSTSTTSTSTTTILSCDECVSCLICLDNSCEWCDEWFGFGSCKNNCIPGWWGSANCLGVCYITSCEGAESSTTSSTTSSTSSSTTSTANTSSTTSTTTTIPETSTSTSSTINSTTSSTTSTANTSTTTTANTSTTTTTTIPPLLIFVDRPENTTYNSIPIDLNVTTNETASACLWAINETINDMNGSNTTWYDFITCDIGTHHLFVFCNDTYGNISSNDTVWFTYQTTTTSTTTTTVSGGGGGGRGTTTTTTIKPELSDGKVEIVSLNIKKDNSESIDIEDWSGGIEKVVLHASQSIFKGRITIKKLDTYEIQQIPVSLPGGWKVYHYLEIDTENIDNKTGSVTLYFFMGKDWIEENSIEKVSLWRYDTGWEELDTELVREDSEMAYYRSTFRGFSYFSLAGKAREEVWVSPTTTVSKIDTMCGNGICDPEETEITCPMDCEPATSGGPNIFLILIPVLIVAAIAVLFLFFNYTKVEINQILSNPEKYAGKRVAINGDIVYSKHLTDGNTSYTITSQTGEIKGLSGHAGYEGRGYIKGVIKSDESGLYIKF